MASGLVGVLVGGFLTLSGTFFISAYRRHIERKRFCRALKVEIELMERWFDTIESIDYIKSDNTPEENAKLRLEEYGEEQINKWYRQIVRDSEASLQFDIYMENQDKLGLLNVEQATSVILYYREIQMWKRSLEKPVDHSPETKAEII